MILLEYEAKSILKTRTVPIPTATVVRRGEVVPDTPLPIVVKSQVPTGGRGKQGGIRIVNTTSELNKTVEALFNLSIGTYTPQTLLLEEKLDIDREFYLSLLIDAASADILIVAHPSGGIEVEENNQDDFLKLPYVPGEENRIGESLAELFDLPEQVFVFQDMVRNLGQCFVRNDATLLEVNPLILTKSGDLVVADCKMTLDDAAAFRHPEWNFEQTSKEVNFVSLDEDGTVGIIANGAGLAMATVDAVADAGMRPANFLDVGGGANTASVLTAFRRIMEYRSVKAIVINIFAGITRCDEVARAIIEAKEQIADLPPLCIRLAGTNYTEAKVLLDDAEISLLPTLKDCLDTAKKEVSRG